jgi:hypothetical protein
VLALEGQRRALRVVLVVGAVRTGGFGDVGELPFQCPDALLSGGPFGE